MKKPKVSICVPNLNTRPFLPERFQTIFSQSFQDWELLVYDSYSTDGAWDYIRDIAAKEPRMRAWQGPREGAPVSWNPCIRQAGGEYVYIATSDDTMPPDCLQKLVAALDSNPDCDIAHCPLRAIDENGREAEEMCKWWSKYSVFADTSGPMLHRLHVRRAPLDGLLHLLGGSVYISITQLLIRRTLFDRVGFFEPTWGSVSDFNWNMRAGLVANTIHVPDTWGGWRIHRNQATAAHAFGSADYADRVEAMIAHAIENSHHLLAPAVQQRLVCSWLKEAAKYRAFRTQVIARERSPIRKRGFILARAFLASAPARDYVKSYLLRRSNSHWVQTRLDEVGVGPLLVTPHSTPRTAAVMRPDSSHE